MAGDIFISPGKSLASSTAAIHAIVDRTRAEFSTECEKYVDSIFTTLEAFNFIRLDQLEADAFNCFYQATTEAFRRYKNSGPRGEPPYDAYRMIVREWTELIRLLVEDSRLVASQKATPETPD